MLTLRFSSRLSFGIQPRNPPENTPEFDSTLEFCKIVSFFDFCEAYNQGLYAPLSAVLIDSAYEIYGLI